MHFIYIILADYTIIKHKTALYGSKYRKNYHGVA